MEKQSHTSVAPNTYQPIITTQLMSVAQLLDSLACEVERTNSFGQRLRYDYETPEPMIATSKDNEEPYSLISTLVVVESRLAGLILKLEAVNDKCQALV